jgi:sec-independent protein translocase protein TatB
MFDFGLSMGELMVIALVALIVVGPKDLPRMLRMVGRFVTRVRGMAGEFQRHLDSAIREAGIDDVKKEVTSMTNFTVTADIDKQMTEEFRKQSSEIKSMIDAPAKAAEPAVAPAEAAPTEAAAAPTEPPPPAEAAPTEPPPPAAAAPTEPPSPAAAAPTEPPSPVKAAPVELVPPASQEGTKASA